MSAEEEEKGIRNAQIDIDDASQSFYLRYYSGHQGRFGHEFLGT